ncbi:2-oxoglutarate dehydrogenase complex dihydrolipoyllysine-residue succinyltransferase [Candidatus Pandoraea novymonadis]|uniref:Dihydrolipoyllysine-residue succinyltransferase component of 2-oxoglutarate dehydrogenase complex n=1 Tax=Candidatus Pandoraea novymonadis TaxID=1808959 RepID=A0ABX5FF26_9BURK|nr:2-oxoglutarate dehydrogenase complex dihydrolipoyllysine-residue succinyltransferase [Candidatus Pandoraea novymonadis]PSB92304.1 Dihydrolipoyllysine-residue succinyltransferase component of 2-oxoglutarate dehydrogenase complex [Candidatus Pandoraea novymonadis]
MAIVEVKVPQFSESVSEGTLLDWKKKVGESFTQDETIIEVETDKVVLEVPAPSAGVLVAVFANVGDTVTSEQIIAKIDTDFDVSTITPLDANVAPLATGSAAVTPASPAATKLLTEGGLSAAQIQISGSGRDGRVTKGDVISVFASASKSNSTAVMNAAVPTQRQTLQTIITTPAVCETSLEGRSEQRVPMSRLRARIAERLLQSQQMNAILTTFNEVNMKPVIDLRNKYKEKFEKEHGVKLGFMSFFVKAAVHALKKYPAVNASIDGNDIVYHGYFDIGIAVGSPRGLVVPILRNADQMSLADIEKKVAEYGKKAADGKLSIEEMSGGTFSISNGGVFGSMLSTPIINPPQSAILGVHATKERPVVENGEIVIRPMNYLAMSYDHRIIDGREAVLSLVTIKDALEDPARLLLDL